MTRLSAHRLSATSSRHHQQGLGMLGWLAGLVVVGILGTMAINMIPVYMDDSTVNKSIEALLADPRINLMSQAEMQESLGKRFDVNTVTNIGIGDVSIVRGNGNVTVGVDYEVKKPLFYNVSVVMHFKHDYTKALAVQ